MRRILPLWRCRGGPALSLFPPLAFGMPLVDAVPLSGGFDRVSQIAGVVGLICLPRSAPVPWAPLRTLLCGRRRRRWCSALDDLDAPVLRLAHTWRRRYLEVVLADPRDS